ncbi:MAG: aspartate--tRNA ligase [Nanoarchaeota archaeon]|nr:aspartate--tRNA ligase [Nanoarchaeota archaeon]
MLRTHTCGELCGKDADKKVKLCGWIVSHRVQGKIGFIILKDRYGVVQIFVDGDLSKKVGVLKRESVISVEGVVKKRPINQIKKEINTGEIEVVAKVIEVLSGAEELPMEIEGVDSNEETRLRYRYLDLRSNKMHHNLVLRHKTIKAIRDFLDKEGFLEIETPFLAKSTPEGARDYLVPSRIQKGKFYALPQSPQLFKQILMISGYDKYFQIVKCFRDEDLRSDRQPEFTQMDLEMSFVDEGDIYELIENMLKHIFKQVLGQDLKIPFQRIPYDEAMKKYKSDKPDLRKKGEKFGFAWVVDFPMFEYSKEEKRYKAMHHPFTRPVNFNFKDMGKVKARAYDLVLNGVEIGGGSLRIYNREDQFKVFEALGIGKKEAEKKFGFLLEAMKYGNPPLGGIALGLDRIIQLFCGENSIREVIAFPKNKDAVDLMLDTPSEVEKNQLDELGIKFK